MGTLACDNEKIERMFNEFAKTRDTRLRDELVLAHRNLARFLAGRFINSGEPLEDLVQVAIIGLIRAIDRYDPERGLRFDTFAAPTIIGEIKHHFRDNKWLLKVPRLEIELSVKVFKCSDRMSQVLGREPTFEEISQELNLPVEVIIDAIVAGQTYDVESLDSKLNKGDSESSSSVGEMIGGIDSSIENFVAYGDLRLALDRIDPRLKTVIDYRYFIGLSQAEVAKRMNIHQSWASALQIKALKQLRTVMEKIAREDGALLDNPEIGQIIELSKKTAVKREEIPVSDVSNAVSEGQENHSNTNKVVSLGLKEARMVLVLGTCFPNGEKFSLNYQELALIVGLPTGESASSCLYTLVNKGFLQREGNRSNLVLSVIKNTRFMVNYRNIKGGHEIFPGLCVEPGECETDSLAQRLMGMDKYSEIVKEWKTAILGKDFTEELKKGKDSNTVPHIEEKKTEYVDYQPTVQTELVKESRPELERLNSMKIACEYILEAFETAIEGILRATNR